MRARRFAVNNSQNKILKIAGIVVAALIVIAIAMPLFVNVNSYRPQIESSLTSALGRPVKVGNLSLSILTGSVEADQLSIADDPKFGNSPFLQAKTLKVGRGVAAPDFQQEP